MHETPGAYSGRSESTRIHGKGREEAVVVSARKVVMGGKSPTTTLNPL